MILDALIGGFLFAGLILGLKFGLKQAAGLAAAIICVQTGALAIAALLGWLMFKLFGSADYLVRTCSFFGFLILGLTLGIRSVLNKLAHGEGKPIPAAVNGLGGALFGVLAGFSGFHAAFLFAIQLPILAAPLAPQFADREDAGEAQGAILPAAEWQAGRDQWLPSAADRAYVASLMAPVVERGRMANWIAPPARGINRQPIDFEYVKLN